MQKIKRIELFHYKCNQTIANRNNQQYLNVDLAYSTINSTSKRKLSFEFNVLSVHYVDIHNMKNLITVPNLT